MSGARQRATILPRDAVPVEPGSQLENDVFDPTRVRVEIVTMSGPAAVVVFRFRMDLVEVWRDGHCCGVFDRERLRAWLAEPIHPLVRDEVTLTLDRAVDNRGRVAITLPDVRAWTLSPVELMNLQERV